ncbi:MAG: hypothetical protein A3D92_09715 [Bacteroidetes bacterium RIFCSPHIGHO2_02_FULL_44_7]|nr:MAG: hypothetical protein A3D92_09715 [Bacteroidetes bacterium RIFCSPHIGHO2_02_FULL_44_7]
MDLIPLWMTTKPLEDRFSGNEFYPQLIGARSSVQRNKKINYRTTNSIIRTANDSGEISLLSNKIFSFQSFGK